MTLRALEEALKVGKTSSQTQLTIIEARNNLAEEYQPMVDTAASLGAELGHILRKIENRVYPAHTNRVTYEDVRTQSRIVTPIDDATAALALAADMAHDHPEEIVNEKVAALETAAERDVRRKYRGQPVKRATVKREVRRVLREIRDEDRPRIREEQLQRATTRLYESAEAGANIVGRTASEIYQVQDLRTTLYTILDLATPVVSRDVATSVYPAVLGRIQQHEDRHAAGHVIRLKQPDRKDSLGSRRGDTRFDPDYLSKESLEEHVQELMDASSESVFEHLRRQNRRREARTLRALTKKHGKINPELPDIVKQLAKCTLAINEGIKYLASQPRISYSLGELIEYSIFSHAITLKDVAFQEQQWLLAYTDVPKKVMRSLPELKREFQEYLETDSGREFQTAHTMGEHDGALLNATMMTSDFARRVKNPEVAFRYILKVGEVAARFVWDFCAVRGFNEDTLRRTEEPRASMSSVFYVRGDLSALLRQALKVPTQK